MTPEHIEKLQVGRAARKAAGPAGSVEWTMLGEERTRYLSQVVPDLHKALLLRVFTGKASPREHIKANCLCCAGYVREEITQCSVNLCAFHDIRPYQQSEAREAA
jgi:hypothetical protein